MNDSANHPLILASKSARRRELLDMTGIPFTIRVSEADESDAPLDLTGAEIVGAYDDPTGVTARVINIAVRKALAVAAESGPDDVILAADTVVADGCDVIGKPKDLADADRILHRLSGHTHRVVTVYVVCGGGKMRIRPTSTSVTFRDLSDAEIEDYISGSEVLDKAGAYGIQDRAALFVSRVEGDFYNIVGLPVVWLREDLAAFGVSV